MCRSVRQTHGVIEQASDTVGSKKQAENTSESAGQTDRVMEPNKVRKEQTGRDIEQATSERVDQTRGDTEDAPATRESTGQTQRVVEQASDMSKSDQQTVRVIEQAQNTSEQDGQTDRMMEPPIVPTEASEGVLQTGGDIEEANVTCELDEQTQRVIEHGLDKCESDRLTAGVIEQAGNDCDSFRHTDLRTEHATQIGRIVEQVTMSESARQTLIVIEQASDMSESDNLTTRVIELAEKLSEQVGQTNLRIEPAEHVRTVLDQNVVMSERVELTRKVIEEAKDVKNSDIQTATVTEPDTSVKIPHVIIRGQQSIKNYFTRIEGSDRQDQQQSCYTDSPDNLKTSATVTSEEGRKSLIMVANNVVGLFPAMKEANTGKSVEKQVLHSPIVVKGVKFREVARYVAGNRKLCGDLSEVENVLPWRRKSGKGGKAPGMQNPEMKGKKSGLESVWQFPDNKPTPYQ